MSARLVNLTAAVGLVVCTAGLAADKRLEPKTHTVTIEGMRFSRSA